MSIHLNRYITCYLHSFKTAWHIKVHFSTDPQEVDRQFNWLLSESCHVVSHWGNSAQLHHVIKFFALLISMGLYKKDITPLLTHWSYVFLALTHQSVYPQPMKRPYRDVENEEPEDDGPVFNAFKTAREQLVWPELEQSSLSLSSSSSLSSSPPPPLLLLLIIIITIIIIFFQF